MNLIRNYSIEASRSIIGDAEKFTKSTINEVIKKSNEDMINRIEKTIEGEKPLKIVRIPHTRDIYVANNVLKVVRENQSNPRNILYLMGALTLLLGGATTIAMLTPQQKKTGEDIEKFIKKKFVNYTPKDYKDEEEFNKDYINFMKYASVNAGNYDTDDELLKGFFDK